MKRIILAAIVCLMLSSCSDGNEAHRVLIAQGYTNIKTTGYAFWGCGSDDTVRTGFTATSPRGLKVEGVVCGGMLFKGSTVRIK